MGTQRREKPWSQNRSLPIHSARRSILYAVEHNQVVIIQGETGSGKTTQLPVFLYEAGWCDTEGVIRYRSQRPDEQQKPFKIACTQPRRVSAMSCAKYLSRHYAFKGEREVGHRVRFDSTACEETKVIFMTDGYLLQLMYRSPLLAEFSVVIIDEVHERSVNSDLLLALLRKVLLKRKDLRVILASATISSTVEESFLSFFKHTECAVIHVPGREHEVDTYYLEQPCHNYIEQSLTVIKNIHLNQQLSQSSKEGGDILVFLPGKEEIDYLEQLLKDEIASHDEMNTLQIAKLHSAMSAREQFSVVNSTTSERYNKERGGRRTGDGEDSRAADGAASCRRCILSTNIAETSLTIPNVVFVIDTLFCNSSFYDQKLERKCLITTPISKEQSEQRKGRAGRVRKGHCFRLCTAEEFNTLPASAIPEIQRIEFSSTLMRLKRLGIQNTARFAFLSPPSSQAVANSYQRLFSLGIVGSLGRLTADIGEISSRFPMTNPHLAFLLAKCLTTEKWKVLENEVLALIAMLEAVSNTQSLFSRFHNQKEREKVLSTMKFLGSKEGDFLFLINLFLHFRHHNRSRNWCYESGLNYGSLSFANNVYEKLSTFVRHWKPTLDSSTRKNYKRGRKQLDEPEEFNVGQEVTKLLVTALFENIARLDSRSSGYVLVKSGRRVKLHQESIYSHFGMPPAFVLFWQNILVKDDEALKIVATVNPALLFEVADHYYEMPSFVQATGSSVALRGSQKVKQASGALKKKKRVLLDQYR